jgi:hypothetical protein
MMKPKPLTNEQKAAYQQHVRDKTRPLRIRFFSEWLLTVLLGVGVLALIGYGGVYAWSLVYAKDKADHLEQRIQEHIRDSQRDPD